MLIKIQSEMEKPASHSRSDAFSVNATQTSWKKDGKYFCACARFNAAYKPTTWPQGAHVEFKPGGTVHFFTACAGAPSSQDALSALAMRIGEVELRWFVFLFTGGVFAGCVVTTEWLERTKILCLCLQSGSQHIYQPIGKPGLLTSVTFNCKKMTSSTHEAPTLMLMPLFHFRARCSS